MHVGRNKRRCRDDGFNPRVISTARYLDTLLLLGNFAVHDLPIKYQMFSAEVLMIEFNNAK